MAERQDRLQNQLDMFGEVAPRRPGRGRCDKGKPGESRERKAARCDAEERSSSTLGKSCTKAPQVPLSP
jgi:hypothetical protein